MAQPLSEHDEDFGSLDDFAPEQPAVEARHADFAPEQLAVDFAPELLAVQPIHADLEPVALPLADTRRDAGNARSWFVGILVLLIVGGVWLGLRAIPPAAAPSEMTRGKNRLFDGGAAADRTTWDRPSPFPHHPNPIGQFPSIAARRLSRNRGRRPSRNRGRRPSRNRGSALRRETAVGARRGTAVGARRWFPRQGRRKAVSAAIACRRVPGQSSNAWSRDSARPESAASGAHWRRGSIGTRGRP